VPCWFNSMLPLRNAVGSSNLGYTVDLSVWPWYCLSNHKERGSESRRSHRHFPFQRLCPPKDETFVASRSPSLLMLEICQVNEPSTLTSSSRPSVVAGEVLYDAQSAAIGKWPTA
jgi:hypothetical protein